MFKKYQSNYCVREVENIITRVYPGFATREQRKSSHVFAYVHFNKMGNHLKHFRVFCKIVVNFAYKCLTAGYTVPEQKSRACREAHSDADVQNLIYRGTGIDPLLECLCYSKSILEETVVVRYMDIII